MATQSKCMKLATLGCIAMALLASNCLAQEYGGGRQQPLTRPAEPYMGEVSTQPIRIRVAPEVEAAKLIYRVGAVYPREAAAQKRTGQVVLHAIIATDGTIERLDFVSGPKIFEKSAKDAVRLWRYQPALVKGAPAEVDTTIRLSYILEESPPERASQNTTALGGQSGLAEESSTSASHGSDGPANPRILVSADIQANNLIHVVQPVSAAGQHVTGTVTVHAVIRGDGLIESVTYASGPQELAAPAIEAVRQWRYRPTTLNGEPFEVDTTVRVVFAFDKHGRLKPQPNASKSEK